MTIGTVRWLNVPKGYGFIKPDDGGFDVLVDICALERTRIASLDQGQQLIFEVVRDERIGRSRAENTSVSGTRSSPVRTVRSKRTGKRCRCHRPFAVIASHSRLRD